VWLRLLGAMLLLFGIAIGLTIWMLVPCIGWISGPGMLAFATLVIGPLVAPVVVLERKSAAQALRRAWDLTRRRFWWVLGFVFILFVFGQIVVSGPAALLSLGLSFLVGDSFDLATQTLLRTIIQSLSSLVLSLLYLPLQLTAITLVYFDLRVRTEGFDLAWQSSHPEGQAGEAGDITAIISQAPPAASDSLMTTNELGYFILLTIGTVALYGILIGLITILGVALFSTAGAGGF
jgi:hypothetical protein